MKKLLLIGFLAMALFSCKKDEEDNEPLETTTNVNLDDCTPETDIFLEGRKMTYDYTVRASDGTSIIDMFTCEYITEQKKISGSKVFLEEREIKFNNEFDELLYGSFGAALSVDGYLVECGGRVYGDLDENMLFAQVTFDLNLPLGAKTLYKGKTTAGNNATTELTRKQNNITINAAGKTFTCILFEYDAISDAPGAQRAFGAIWVDPAYGVIKYEGNTVKSILKSINK